MEKITPRIQALASSIFKRRNDMSANDMSQDARPPPYVLSRQCRFERLVTLVTLTLLLILSIPALALKAYSYSFIESNMEMGFYLVNEQTGKAMEDALVAALPLHLFRVPEKLVLVVAMISILLSMLHLIFVVCDWKACMRVSGPYIVGNILHPNRATDSDSRLSPQRHRCSYHQCRLGNGCSHRSFRVSRAVIQVPTRPNSQSTQRCVSIRLPIFPLRFRLF